MITFTQQEDRGVSMNYKSFTAIISFVATPVIISFQIKIQDPLTPNNALLPRYIYVKDKIGTEIQLKTVARTLLVFLDTTEFGAGAGAVASQLVEALSSQPCPILVSHALLCTIFSSYAQKNHIVEKGKKSFNINEWLIKSAIANRYDPEKSELFLLIPKSYILRKVQEERGIKASFTELIIKENFNLDKFLGLKLSSMVTIDDTREQWDKRFKLASENLTAHFELLIEDKPPRVGKKKKKREQRLFVSQQSYNNDTENILPQWNIYMTGHGETKTEYSVPTIVGIKPEVFNKWLNTINNQIVTKFLMYTSCYATGFNHQRIYNELSNGIGDAYPFPIVAVGIVETAVAQNLLVDYKKFVELAESEKPVAYLILLQTLLNGITVFFENKMNITNEDVIAAFVVRNLPLIRLPNRPVFLPLIPVFEFTQLMADTHSVEKPLDIRAFIKKNIDPQVVIKSPSTNRAFIVILDAQYIPCDIVITTEYGKNSFLILSSLSTPRIMHVFDREVFFDSTLDDFFKMFQYPLYGERKIFYIRRLTLKDSKGLLNRYQDVIIYMQPKIITTGISSTNIIEVYYTAVQDGQQYRSMLPEFKPQTGVIEYSIKSEYSSHLKAIRKEYEERQKTFDQYQTIIEKRLKQGVREASNFNALVDLNNELAVLAMR
jgi:hypothetical protein